MLLPCDIPASDTEAGVESSAVDGLEGMMLLKEAASAVFTQVTGFLDWLQLGVAEVWCACAQHP